MHDDNDDFEIHEKHGGEEGEPWLMSYADLMTLLFGFFVVMYSFSSEEDPKQWLKVRREISTYFGGKYVNEYAQMKEDVMISLAQNPDLQNKVQLESSPEGLKISFQSHALFDSGEAKLRPKMLETLEVLSQLIQAYGSDTMAIVVEGHSDDVPIETPQFPSNWELSAARAGSVVRALQRSGMDAKNFEVKAFADTKPQLPNRDELGQPIPENRAINRRVVLSIRRKNPFRDREPANEQKVERPEH